jgi:hypothetical protein
MSCKISTLTAAACDTQAIPVYDKMGQIILRPDIRREVVKAGQLSPFISIMMDLTQALSQDASGKAYREVTTREYYTQEVNCTSDDWSFFISTVSGAAANTKTATVSSEYGSDGKYSMPIAGHRATISYNDGTFVNCDITAVSVTTAGAHTVTLKALNGATFALTSQSRYKVVMAKMKTYIKDDSNCIVTHGIAQNAPNLIKGFVQKYESGICIKEDTADHYRYENAPLGDFAVPMWDSATNTWVESMNVDQMVKGQLYQDRMQNMAYQLMLGEHNAVTKEGVDGVITTAFKRGMFKFPKHNVANPDVLKRILRNIASNLKKSNINCKTVVIWHDDIAGGKISDAIMKIVGFDRDYVAQVQGFNLDNNGILDWYQFKGIRNFDGRGIDFMFKNLEIEALGMPHMTDFCYIQPLVPFTDSMGKKVAPVEMVKLASRTGDKLGSIYTDNTMARGCRAINVYAKDSFGVDNHSAQFSGYIKG